MHYCRCYNGHLQSNQHVERRRFDRSFNMVNNIIEKTQEQYVTGREVFNYGNITSRTSNIGTVYLTSTLGSPNDQSFESSLFMANRNEINGNHSTPNTFSNKNKKNLDNGLSNNFGINNSNLFPKIYRSVFITDITYVIEMTPDGPAYFKKPTKWIEKLNFYDPLNKENGYEAQRKADRLPSIPLSLLNKRIQHYDDINKNNLSYKDKDKDKDTLNKVRGNHLLDYKNNVVSSNLYNRFQHCQEKPIQRSSYIDYFDNDGGIRRAKSYSDLRHIDSLSRHEGHSGLSSRHERHDGLVSKYEGLSGLSSRHDGHNSLFSRHERHDSSVSIYEKYDISALRREGLNGLSSNHERIINMLSRHKELFDSRSRHERCSSVGLIDGNQESGIIHRNMSYEFEHNRESKSYSLSSTTTLSNGYQFSGFTSLLDNSPSKIDKEGEHTLTNSPKSKQWRHSYSTSDSKNSGKRVLRERFLDNDSSNETEPSRKRIRTSTFSTTNMF